MGKGCLSWMVTYSVEEKTKTIHNRFKRKMKLKIINIYETINSRIDNY